jgi:hypothetical protein
VAFSRAFSEVENIQTRGRSIRSEPAANKKTARVFPKKRESFKPTLLFFRAGTAVGVETEIESVAIDASYLFNSPS